MSDQKFRYPWKKENFIARLKKLTKSRKNKSSIVYIYRTPDNSTFRYRAYNMCEALDKSAEFSGVYFFVDELARLSKYIAHIHHLVIVRVPWTIELDQFMSQAFAKNIKCYFDIDDLIFDIKKLPYVLNAIGVHMNQGNYECSFSYTAQLFLTASLCDYYITTNDFLAEKIRENFKKSIFIMPNFINEQQLEISHKLWESKSRYAAPDNNMYKFLLGYFSGSPTHNRDFESISGDLYLLMKKYAHIHLRLTGYLDLPEILKKFQSKKRIEYLPLQNYVDLQTKIAECGVNLIPLLVNEFSHCKSELKYFEAAAAGTISVASPTFIYQKIIQDNHNGFLASPGMWVEKIEQIIADKEQADHIRQNARFHALEHYSGSKILKQIENIFN